MQNIVDPRDGLKVEYRIENQVREGLTFADLDHAIDEVFEEHRETRHNEDSDEFAEARSRRIAKVRQMS